MNARLWNDHTEDWVQMYDEKQVVVPGKKHGEGKNFIFMHHDDAYKICASYSPIVRDGMGRDLNPKMLRVERIGDDDLAKLRAAQKCMACGVDFPTAEALASHAKTHESRLLKEKPNALK